MAEPRIMAVRVSEQTREEFEKAAKKDHRNISDALRLIIEQYIKKHLKHSR